MQLSPLLQEYLIENGSLPLPERGLLTIDYEPAYLQKADSKMIAPTSDVLFVPLGMQESEMKNLSSFISKKLNISFEQANELLKQKDIGEAVIKEMGNLIKWPDSEILRSKNKQKIKSTSLVSLSDYLPSFTIEKIHRQPATIAEAIAPAESISEETYLEYDKPIAKDNWWVWALVIFALSAILIIYRFA